MLMTRQSSLLLIPFAIVPDAQKILLEATVATRGKMTIQTTKLAGDLNSTGRAAGTDATTSRCSGVPWVGRGPLLATRWWWRVGLALSTRSSVGGGEARRRSASLDALFRGKESRI